MRTIIKLAIAALVLHAAYQVGTAYWDHYQFTDAVQQIAQFGEREPIAEIKKRVIDLAAERTLPIAEDAITVTRRNAASTSSAATRARSCWRPATSGRGRSRSTWWC